MKTATPAPPERRRRFIRGTFTLVGSAYALSGALLVLAPGFFLAYIGRFPPLNRHYMGDAGVFVLAVGIGLLLVRKAPWGQPAMAAMGLAATQLHALNHLYDAVFQHPELSHWLLDVVPNLLLSGLYLAAYRMIRKSEMSPG